MTKEEIKKLVADLMEEKTKIEAELRTIASENPLVKGDFEVRVEDQGSSVEDAGEEAAELDRNQAMVDMLERRLKEIDATLEKVESGTYGVCTDCANPIEEPRLKAMPVAALCMSCAQKRENS
jgi:RNA polymerase-binding transcription factor DksA